MRKTLLIASQVFDLEQVGVMGILNITPDSFWEGSRLQTEKHILLQTQKMIAEGAHILDIGGYSTRPNAADVPENEEIRRVVEAIKLIRQEIGNFPISIDTFRSKVAEEAVKVGANLINDISGGKLDSAMFETAGRLGVPYILMHSKGTPQTMQEMTDYEDIVLEMIDYFQEKIFKLRKFGVKDIILDLGFGFAKTTEQNYLLLEKLPLFQIFELPILVGVSRKSMIWRKLGITPTEALNGTTALNTLAIKNGANFLRVHDVREAVEVVNLLKKVP